MPLCFPSRTFLDLQDHSKPRFGSQNTKIHLEGKKAHLLDFSTIKKTNCYIEAHESNGPPGHIPSALAQYGTSGCTRIEHTLDNHWFWSGFGVTAFSTVSETLWFALDHVARPLAQYGSFAGLNWRNFMETDLKATDLFLEKRIFRKLLLFR